MNISGTIQTQGNFTIKVYDKHGNIKQELPKIKNVITDTGIKMLNGNTHNTHKGNSITNNYSIFSDCFIGTGTGTPSVADTKMFAFEAEDNQSFSGRDYIEDSTHEEHSGFVKLVNSRRYVFNVSNKNITEVGLGYMYQNTPDAPNYALYTHALIKDNLGNPTAITVAEGDILEILYEISVYLDARQIKGEYQQQTINGDSITTQNIEYSLQMRNFSSNAAGIASFIPAILKPTFYADPETNKESFNLDNYDWLNSQNHSKLSGRYDTVYYSTSKNEWAKQAGYLGWEHKKGGNGVTFYVSPYDANFNSGIRAISFDIYSATNSNLANYLIVLNDKAGNNAIMKTNEQVLEFTVDYKVVRKEN